MYIKSFSSGLSECKCKSSSNKILKKLIEPETGFPCSPIFEKLSIPNLKPLAHVLWLFMETKRICFGTDPQLVDERFPKRYTEITDLIIVLKGLS